MRGSRVLTLFEYLAYTDPGILLDLQWYGLLIIGDHFPAAAVKMMRHAVYKRIGRRLRQVSVA